MTTLNLRPTVEAVADPIVDRNFRAIVAALNALGIYAGTGTPEGAVTAGVGSIYRRLNGGAATTLYVKESGTGNVGWIAK